MKRRDKHEPTPEQALEYIATAISDLNERSFEGFPIGYESYMETERKRYGSITLHDFRLEVARIMAKRKEYFTSDYRHELTPAHALVCRILGSTVQMNALIAELEREVAA